MRTNSFLLACGVAFFCATTFAQSLHFGTNRIAPGEILRFSVPLNPRAKYELSRARMPQVAQAQGALVLPAGCTNLTKPVRLLILSVPSGGSAISWLPSVTNTVLAQGWAILAADGPKIPAEQDSIQLGWGMLSSALDHLGRTWP